MDIRKIGVVGTFAAGAALALAPLAAADTPAAPDLSSLVSAEQQSMNFLFEANTAIAGDSKDVVAASATNPFDTINAADIDTVQGTTVADGTTSTVPTTFDYLTYGVDPVNAGLAGDPGSYNDLNGALVQFDDALNTELYGLENNNMLDAGVLTDLFGSDKSIDAALYDSTGAFNSVSDTADAFLHNGMGDLAGFFDLGAL
ncbi:hypothetical protein KIH27_13035 [Mycobacterium sp. M1]|uniref:Uncharacterized protein n=1 Tax=Mycolicibacter acidiphilus TaxID=2835306 RepID=A0ABS5RJQ0_9MYCO|nr:hypothetical protein [Mycolicibacter acidiphilus]MBS9534511.1 hypothetical protein [Mycolicibacter acidiphilus]